MTVLIVGALLVLAGLAGSVSACQASADETHVVMAGLSGLSLAVGLVLLAVGAGRRGYHRRPPGAPPGDMDIDKATEPPPDQPPLAR
jgi:hypothetical protein